MTITIDATPASADANSYITLAEASAYFEAHRFDTIWTGLADDAARNQRIVEAARAIDRLPFSGSKYALAQAMEFPRAEDYLYYGASIPQKVKDAQCEMIAYLDILLTSSGGMVDDREIVELSIEGAVRIKYEDRTVTLQQESQSTAGSTFEAIRGLLRQWIGSSSSGTFSWVKEA